MGKRIEDWIGQYRHMDWAVLYMRLFAGGMMHLPQYTAKIAGLQRNRQFVPVVRLGRQRGDVRRRDGGRVLLAVAIIMGIWVRMSALILSLGILLMVRLGRIRRRGAGVRVAGRLRLPDYFRRRTLRLRHGADSRQAKKVNHTDNIITADCPYVGGKVVTLPRFVFF